MSARMHPQDLRAIVAGLIWANSTPAYSAADCSADADTLLAELERTAKPEPGPDTPRWTTIQALQGAVTLANARADEAEASEAHSKAALEVFQGAIERVREALGCHPGDSTLGAIQDLKGRLETAISSSADAEAQVDRLNQEVDRLRRELEVRTAELEGARAAAGAPRVVADAKREERERIIALLDGWVTVPELYSTKWEPPTPFLEWDAEKKRLRLAASFLRSVLEAQP